MYVLRINILLINFITFGRLCYIVYRLYPTLSVPSAERVAMGGEGRGIKFTASIAIAIVRYRFSPLLIVSLFHKSTVTAAVSCPLSV